MDRFSDPNCQNSIGSTGNNKGVDLSCSEFDGAQSQVGPGFQLAEMNTDSEQKCFFDC